MLELLECDGKKTRKEGIQNRGGVLISARRGCGENGQIRRMYGDA